MEPDGSYFYLVFLVVLIGIGAFLTMSEVAIISLNDNKVRKMAQEGNRSAQLLVRLINEPSKFLATIQVGITVSGFLTSALAANLFAGRLALGLRQLRISPTLRHAIALVVVTLLLAFFTLVFSELVPKRIGMRYHEKIAFAVARPLSFIAMVEKPFVLLLSTATNGILRLLGLDPGQMPEKVTEEEIRMMVDVGGETGSIEKDETKMINNIFLLDDRTAVEVMTPRTEMTALEIDAGLSQTISTALETGYSRIPVYEETLDSIKGILYVKDLLGLVMEDPDNDFVLADTIRPDPFCVLESTNCKTVLEELQQRKMQMAIVVDEYGGTSGLVTMEDLLESIVGNIQDEYDDEEEDIFPISKDVYMLDGLADLEEIGEFLGLTFDEAATEEYETIGGYIVECLGYIPGENERPSVQLSNILFTVLNMDERRISKLRAEVLPEAPVEVREKNGKGEK